MRSAGDRQVRHDEHRPLRGSRLPALHPRHAAGDARGGEVGEWPAGGIRT